MSATNTSKSVHMQLYSTLPDFVPSPVFAASRPAMQTRHFTFSTYSGFFKYDSANDHPEVLPPVADNFGLKENKTWAELLETLTSLDQSSTDGSSHKLLFANRHGQGYHNVAEAEYGTVEWDEHWSKLNGNDKITWGPDALLTPLGIEQAQEVNKGWKAFLQQDDAPPLPKKLYVSPLSRAISTLEAAYKDILVNTSADRLEVRPLVKEGFREHYGEHTCDQRRAKSAIQADYPNVDFEPRFTEDDELWTATRESEDHLDTRIQQTLEDVWASDRASVIGLTSHSGVMQSLFRVTKHHPINPTTGAIVPLIIRGTPRV